MEGGREKPKTGYVKKMERNKRREREIVKENSPRMIQMNMKKLRLIGVRREGERKKEREERLSG